MSSATWWPFCFVLNVITYFITGGGSPKGIGIEAMAPGGGGASQHIMAHAIGISVQRPMGSLSMRPSSLRAEDMAASVAFLAIFPVQAGISGMASFWRDNCFTWTPARGRGAMIYVMTSWYGNAFRINVTGPTWWDRSPVDSPHKGPVMWPWIKLGWFCGYLTGR